MLIGAVIWYSYSAEETRQKGFEFGNKLSQIQDEVRQLQMSFNSKITQWNEGDITTEELLEYADSHVLDLSNVVTNYDTLVPPSQFSASVNLFKLSTDRQLESDRYYIEWIKTGLDSNRIRSDSLLQESFDFEMMALGEFNRAKLGYTEYDESEKFQAPDIDIKKVNMIWENMKENCHLMEQSEDVDLCLNQADTWKRDHIP